MVVALMAIVVMMTLAFSVLTVSYSEDVNQRLEQRGTRAFYAAEAGTHEAIVRLNINPTGGSDDETELKWDTANDQPRNPAAVRDPRLVGGLAPDPDPDNYSDSTTSSWRFWNYDPSWRYSGSGNPGDGNYPGATVAQQANLSSAGRVFSYDGASARTLISGSSYEVRVVPHIRNIGGTWYFADERGLQAAANTYYYKVHSQGMFAGKRATIELVTRKYIFGPGIPAAITAAGDVTVSGNGSVGVGEPGDAIANNVAIQSAGTITQSGSGEITGDTRPGRTFPDFEAVFGMSQAQLRQIAQARGTDLTSDPPSGPSTYGQVYWVTGDVLLTGGGPSGWVLGSPSQPVVLVVDGDLTLNSVTIYGLIYVKGAFRNQGSSFIRGAIMVEGTAETDILGTGKEEQKIAYSQNVVNNLGNSSLFPFSPLKGTWKITRG